MRIHRLPPDKVLEILEGRYQTKAKLEVKKILDKLKRNRNKIIMKGGMAVYET